MLGVGEGPGAVRVDPQARGRRDRPDGGEPFDVLMQAADDAPHSSKPTAIPKPKPASRKRSTKPEHVLAGATPYHAPGGKENTPSPPRRSGREPEAEATGNALPAFGRFNIAATPRRAFELATAPVSPASSSELSPVGREMMSDARQQRMRARQLERRRGMWVRE